MDDKTLNIVLWALGSTIALAGLLLGYLQYRRSGPPAAKADEEHPMLPIDAAHDEVVVDHPHEIEQPLLPAELAHDELVVDRPHETEHPMLPAELPAVHRQEMAA